MAHSGALPRSLPSAAMVISEPDSTGAETDPQLLRSYLDGDPTAFARLYDRHDRRCFDFIRRMLGGADDATAEDLHQEAWIAVARQAATYDEDKARFGTWLFTIARHKVMDHFRRAGVVCLAADIGAQADDAMETAADAPAADPEQLACDRQLAAALLREVQALPFVQRETFVLFAHQELSLDEVAQITQVGVETAKSRLRYARQALRARLAHWRVGHA